jgi:hypothetical protein
VARLTQEQTEADRRTRQPAPHHALRLLLSRRRHFSRTRTGQAQTRHFRQLVTRPRRSAREDRQQSRAGAFRHRGQAAPQHQPGKAFFRTGHRAFRAGRMTWPGISWPRAIAPSGADASDQPTRLARPFLEIVR